MAGLNFQTTTIINSNVDKDSNGKALFVAGTDQLHIKRDFVFNKANVKMIRKAEGTPAEMCVATIDFKNLKSTLLNGAAKAYCRLDIYLGVEGAEPFIYSTPWVQKGIPFWVEFTVKSSDSTSVAKHVADMIKQNNLFQVDKDLIKVTVDETNDVLTLTGATEYQRFRKIELNVFDATSDYAEKVDELGEASSAKVKLVKKGKNGFGTYSQIIKDLRLPTMENMQWTHIRQAETPVIDAIYNQYIIEYAAPASNEGLACVGQKLESNTTHVFWVKRESATVPGALVTAWETALGAIDPDGTSGIAAENAAPASVLED